MFDRTGFLAAAAATVAIGVMTAPVQAASVPAIQVSGSNKVPECATPGRLQAYLQSRNDGLSKNFDTIAVEYMKTGEALGVRWDWAFFQMVVETGSLTFKNGSRDGDVRPSQNNFAGMGATGNGERGESFPDVATGVRAHLEHIMLYAGAPVDKPVSERTRKVREWDILTSWQKKFKRPISYADMAQKWAPGSRGYVSTIENVAEKFYDDVCKTADPRPELVAMARGQSVVAVATAQPATPAAAASDTGMAAPTGRDLAKAAIGRGVDKRFALGAAGLAKANSPPVTILNAPGEATAPAFDPPQTEAAATPPISAPAATPPPVTQAASLGAAAAAPIAPKAEAKAKPTACRVFTASYGGQKAVIVKAIVGTVLNYTVLDVNDGQEKREAEAFISAYAKGGALAGEFANQTQALDKAFELCPEG